MIGVVYSKMADHQEVIENAIDNLNKIQGSAQKYHNIITKGHKLLALLQDLDKTEMSESIKDDVKQKCNAVVVYAIQYADTMSFLEDNDMYTNNIYTQALDILDQAWKQVEKLL
jgi:hypothetical protein